MNFSVTAIGTIGLITEKKKKKSWISTSRYKLVWIPNQIF